MNKDIQRRAPNPLVPLLLHVLPSQKERLVKLAKETCRSQSSLGREALTYLFVAYYPIKSN